MITVSEVPRGVFCQGEHPTTPTGFHTIPATFRADIPTGTFRSSKQLWLCRPCAAELHGALGGVL